MNLNEKDYGQDIKITKCKKITDCFVVNKTYSNLINNVISIKELNKYHLILQSKGSNTREFLDDFAKKNNTILKANIELASYSLVVDLLRLV